MSSSDPKILELVVVRHGQSIRNYASKLAHEGNFSLLEQQLAQDDYEPAWSLTETGIIQANKTGDWIRKEFASEPDLILASPYRRTLQTAKALGLKRYFSQDWRLRERRWGDYDGATPPYTAKLYLDDLAHAGERDWKTGFPGGESVLDLIPQVQRFTVEKLRHMEGKTIVLVTHGGAMKALQNVLEGTIADPHQTSVPNASVLHFKIKKIREDGMATGDYELICPWKPEDGNETWQHFG